MIEIERKFLLKSFPIDMSVIDHDRRHILQGYLPGNLIIERVCSVETKSDRFFTRSIKVGTGISRLEIEEHIDETLFRQIWPLTRDLRVIKNRYRRYGEDGLLWELDTFLDRNLFLAEVELKHEDEPVQIPAWLVNHIDKEVTNDPYF